MTKEKVLHVLKIYIDQLEKDGCTAERSSASYSPKPDLNLDTNICMNHLLWMCSEVAVLLNEDRVEKAMRWLGFMQGAFWALGVRTIEQMKEDNMPEALNL